MNQEIGVFVVVCLPSLYGAQKTPKAGPMGGPASPGRFWLWLIGVVFGILVKIVGIDVI